MLLETFKDKPMYAYLMVLVICASAGLQGWLALFTNFAKEVVGVNGFQIGVAQAVREIPGFLTFMVIYVLLIIKEHRLAAWSVVVLGVGIGATGFLTSFPGLLMTTVIMSIGFHYFETTNKFGAEHRRRIHHQPYLRSDHSRDRRQFVVAEMAVALSHRCRTHGRFAVFYAKDQDAVALMGTMPRRFRSSQLGKPLSTSTTNRSAPIPGGKTFVAFSHG
jgi:hypothetical protein